MCGGAASAASDVSTGSPPLSTIGFAVELARRSSRMTANPSRPGISASTRIKSGRRASARSIASAPECAMPPTSSALSCSSETQCLGERLVVVNDQQPRDRRPTEPRPRAQRSTDRRPRSSEPATPKRGTSGRRPDLVQRDFSASRPNELWVADISHVRCWEGLVFFAFVLDAHSRMIVGWQLAPHIRTDLILDALRMALGQRGADVELIHHSDRGSQYTSIDYTQTLADHRVLASVGSVGDAFDNALAESFLDSFKTELIADRVWRSRSQLELAVVEYIGWFNHTRSHQASATSRRRRWRPTTLPGPRPISLSK